MSEVLVTVSKVKAYIKNKGSMNTSGATPEALSNLIRVVLDKAIENARKDGRKTIFDRDIEI